MSGTRRPPGMAAALDRFTAATRNPNYTTFLARHGVRAETITTEDDFGGLPAMTKDDLPEIWPLAGQLDRQEATEPSMVVTSSGSSGKPSYMLRGANSFRTSVAVFDRLFRDVFETGTRPTLVIVCFAFGTWMGGTYALLALLALRTHGHRITVITPGLDLAAAREALTTLGPLFDQVVIAGYPPHMRELLDQAPREVLRQNIRLLIGGEPTSEEARDHILSRLGRTGTPELVIAAYGASEIAFVGNETPATTAVRRAARDDVRLAQTLFDAHRPCSGWSGAPGTGTLVLPTVVEYDPSVCFIEVDPDGYLLFTVEATVPLVRYRVNDQGVVFDGDTFASMLRSTGYPDLATAVKPTAGYLVMFGRTDVAAIVGGANVFPGQIQPALDDAAFAGRVTGTFVASTVEGRTGGDRLCVRVELRRGVTADDHLTTRLAAEIDRTLIRTCSEYRILRERGSIDTEPIVMLEPHGASAFPSAPKQRRVDAGR